MKTDICTPVSRACDKVIDKSMENVDVFFKYTIFNFQTHKTDILFLYSTVHIHPKRSIELCHERALLPLCARIFSVSSIFFTSRVA